MNPTTRYLVALALLTGTTATVLAASASPTSPPCTGQAALGAYHFEVAGVKYKHIPDHLPAGTQVIVKFEIKGCNELTLSWVSYQATKTFKLEDQTVYDATTDDFSQGIHAMAVRIPPCYYQVDFVKGDVIKHFDSENGTTYHDEGRFIEASQSSNKTCGPPPPRCPSDLAAAANPDGSVTLTFTPPAGADNVTIQRATGAGPFSPLVTLPGSATSYNDNTTTPGLTYTYRVNTVDGTQTSKDCETVVVTSVPEFGSATAVGLALAGIAGAGIVVASRRRK